MPDCGTRKGEHEMKITAFYASLLAVLFLFLSVRVIGWRRELRVELGHGDSAELLRRMRVHANFAEYVPFALLLMGLAESMVPPRILLHMVGITLVAGILTLLDGIAYRRERKRGKN